MSILRIPSTNRILLMGIPDWLNNISSDDNEMGLWLVASSYWLLYGTKITYQEEFWIFFFRFVFQVVHSSLYRNFVVTSLNTFFFKMLTLSHSHFTFAKFHVKDSTGVSLEENHPPPAMCVCSYFSFFFVSIQRFYFLSPHRIKKKKRPFWISLSTVQLNYSVAQSNKSTQFYGWWTNTISNTKKIVQKFGFESLLCNQSGVIHIERRKRKINNGIVFR